MSLVAGCVGPIKSLYPPRPGSNAKTVYVVNHGGAHTGIAVRRADIPKGVWPANLDYPRAKYLEVGWGDDDGYRKDWTTGIVTKALVRSTRTVLLFDGFSKTLRENFDDSRYTIIQVQLSATGFERLCRHFERTHAVDRFGRPICLGDDWYRGRGTYCFLNT